MRRIFCQNLKIGPNPISPEESHHARAVLRLEVGESVELFDASGQSGIGLIKQIEHHLVVEVEQIHKTELLQQITVASAVPKGDRADWMVEKLSEIGASRWIPLKTARSVVHPDGPSKYQRWERIATESAKQCKRPGVMAIGELVNLTDYINTIVGKEAQFLSTVPGCTKLNQIAIAKTPILLVGPEGGWSEDEEKMMQSSGLTPASLGQTILRIETAAIVAAAIVALG